MFDFLDRVEPVAEDKYRYIMETQVEPYLEKKRKDACFFSYDSKRIYYEAYEKVLSRGTVVILHGFTETAEKFREISYYFLKAGYSVYAPDLRGHGRSYRTSVKSERVEIDTFDTYAKDLEDFMDKVVIPYTGDRKIYIYSHSLGSLVALLYMMKYPTVVEKAVLSSPMICGNMGMPVAVASAVSGLICCFGGEKISAPGRCVFDSEQTWESSDAASIERFGYYHEKRKKEPLYQTNGPSFGWVKASVKARDKVLSESEGKLQGERMLIFIPEEDKQLLSEYTDIFAEKNRIKVKEVKNSRHEIFMSGNDVLKWYLEEIFEFFKEK